MLETTLERRGRRLLKGGGDDEDIPTDSASPTLHDEQANQIRLGPITRAHAKLIEQQVNLLLIESDVVLNENYILPKSLYVCMIRYHEEDKAQGGEDKVQGGEDKPQEEEDRNLDFGRPNQFGRPTSVTKTAICLYRTPPTEDGLPVKFGRPTSRTSDMGRDSDDPIQKGFTPMSDFRRNSDVRRDGRPTSDGRPKLPARRSDGLRPLYPSFRPPSL